MGYFLGAICVFLVGSAFVVFLMPMGKKDLEAKNAGVTGMNERKKRAILTAGAVMFFLFAAILGSLYARSISLGLPMDFDDLSGKDVYKVYEVIEMQEVIFVINERSDESLCVEVNPQKLANFKEGDRFIRQGKEALFLK